MIGPIYFLVVVLAHDCSTVNGRVFASCARLGSWKLCISSRLLSSAHLCIRCQKTNAIVGNCLFATENTTRSIVKYSTCPGIWHLSQVLLQTACPQVTCTYHRCYFITLLRWAIGNLLSAAARPLAARYFYPCTVYRCCYSDNHIHPREIALQKSHSLSNCYRCAPNEDLINYAPRCSLPQIALLCMLH